MRHTGSEEVLSITGRRPGPVASRPGACGRTLRGCLKAEHLLDNRRQALAAAVHGITIAVWVNTLPRLQRGEPWYEIGVDDPGWRRERYAEPVGR